LSIFFVVIQKQNSAESSWHANPSVVPRTSLASENPLRAARTFWIEPRLLLLDDVRSAAANVLPENGGRPARTGLTTADFSDQPLEFPDKP